MLKHLKGDMSSVAEDNADSEKPNASHKAYTIGGVPILFPYRAYPSQITMMDKIVKCLNKKHNCLLESPTGSGKSLALLCASLAWQKKIKKVIQELEEKLEMELNACGISIPDQYAAPNPNVENNITDNTAQSESVKNQDQCCNKMSPYRREKFETQLDKPQESSKGKRGIIYIDDADDFKPVKKYRCSEGPTILQTEDGAGKSSVNQCCNADGSEENTKALASVSDNSNSSILTHENATNSKGKSVETQSSIPTKLPRIYFGTRTHKQIDQLIRELKKTPYKNSSMTILSSRERTCIHPVASKAENKNEACAELLKLKGHETCKFFRAAKTISHYHPPRLGLAFDLEDLVGLCKKVRACPYFSSRELLFKSDIVFCPYNYLVDPLIRSAMNIELKGSIVIMDEAHNIEDSARDAASTSITLDELEESILNLERVGRHSKTIPDCYKFMAERMSKIAAWLKSNVNNLTDYSSFNTSAKVFAGNNLMNVLSFVDLGSDSFPNFKKQFEMILDDEEKESDTETVEDMDEPKLLAATLTCLKNLCQTLRYLYKNDLTFVPDYRLVVMKSISQTHSKRRSQSSHTLSLNFWCMNPAVAFSDLKGLTHSVIVASGTLSPLNSFQSELGIPFQITLEANHVISKDQVWVGTISKGPNNSSLTATYHNAATFAFQDDIGLLVFQVCSVIPHGILCFLPSYGMLENLVKRWQQTGMWDKLETKKLVLCEPRKQKDFVSIINEFYEAVKGSVSGTEGARNGALFFAVCRGKVSEGLDFADNNARAVITVGIPFPNIKETVVDLKRKYNDMYCSQRPILTGSEWYEIQAFRALNQALGRCIRHRDDFGALIIVDERFQKNPKFCNALSKWIRKEIEHFPRFSDAVNSLTSFADRTGLKAISSEDEG